MYGIPILIHCYGVAYMIIALEDGPKYDYSRGNYDLVRLKLTKIGHKNGALQLNQSFTKIFRQEKDKDESKHQE